MSFMFPHSKETQHIFADKGVSNSRRDAVRVGSVPHITLEGAAGPPNTKMVDVCTEKWKDTVHSKQRQHFTVVHGTDSSTSGKYATDE